MAVLLSDADIARELETVPAWRREGVEITRTFSFPAYLSGIAFVNQAGRLAELSNHHPDMHVGWRKVTCRLSTHSKGGLTDLDFALARKLDGIPA